MNNFPKSCHFAQWQSTDREYEQEHTSPFDAGGDSCRDIVEALKDDTDRFRDGAEPNDDLTLLAFSFMAS